MLKVLMLGVSRTAKGGISSVVNNYYKAKLDKKIKLKYIETVNDKNIFLKSVSIIKGYLLFIFSVFKYDIIHMHMASRNSTFRKNFYLKISKFLHKKVIIHLHGGEFKIFYLNECNKYKQNKIKKLFKFADKVIVLSEEWKIFLSSFVDENKIVILNNSVLLPRNFTKNLKNKKILFLGDIGNRKGIFDLIYVFNDLLKIDRDFELYIGGNGDINKMSNLINELNLNKHVHYLGWIDNNKKKRYLKDCTYYILPSYNENLPISILESMSYKCISISTNVGGIPSLIKNNINGFIIEPGSKEELLNLIINIKDNFLLKKKVSKNAYNTIKNNYVLKKNINDLINIYNDVYKKKEVEYNEKN